VEFWFAENDDSENVERLRDLFWEREDSGCIVTWKILVLVEQGPSWNELMKKHWNTLEGVLKQTRPVVYFQSEEEKDGDDSVPEEAGDEGL